MVQSAAQIRSRRTRAGRHLTLYRPGTAPAAPARSTTVRVHSTARAQSTGRVHSTARANTTSRVPRTAAAGSTAASPARTRPDRLVYRRRRLLAVGLLLLAVAAVLGLAQLIQAGIGGGPLTTTGAAAGSSAAIPAGTRYYVVQPGDTLWSIADRVDPNGDERPLVDALVRETGGSSLYPGERVAIPSRW